MNLKFMQSTSSKLPRLKNNSSATASILARGWSSQQFHVVGHWPSITHPRVLIAGQDLSAKIIKQGSFEEVDLALLSVDAEQLPVSLRLRRNPLCKEPPRVGANVVIVYPERTARSQIISPFLIAPQNRARFSTLINEPEGSGSGVLNEDKKMSSRYHKQQTAEISISQSEWAGRYQLQWICRTFCTSIDDCRFHPSGNSVLIFDIAERRTMSPAPFFAESALGARTNQATATLLVFQRACGARSAS